MTKPQTLVTLCAAFLTLAAGTREWLEHRSSAKLAETAAFNEKRLALLQEENDRLRSLVAKTEGEKQQSAELKIRKEVEEATARIRELPFKQPIQYKMLPRGRIKEVLIQKLSEHYADEDFERYRMGYVAMGYFKNDYPFKQSYIDLLGEQVAAYYDQTSHKLVTFDNTSLESVQNQVILCHELTHALQDQHFGLKALPIELKDNDDRALAALTLIEGDATFTMNAFSADNLSLNALTSGFGQAFTQNLDQLQKAPRLLRESLLFPYLTGVKFCTELHDRGGFRAVSKSFERPPSSTSQILHFEKYLAREEPIDFPRFKEPIQGEQPALSNVAGELGTKVLFTDWLDERTAITASEGWRGDRYYFFPKNNALIWRSTWATAKDATEFSDALEAMIVKRYQAKPANASATVAGVQQFTGLSAEGTPRALEISVHTDGLQVILVDAANEAWCKEASTKFSF